MPSRGSAQARPLIVQDKTFVPKASVVAENDPTWNTAKWGGEGSLWQPHVYMPAQNPGSNAGTNRFGRWMYGPWFWPPATGVKYPPIDNPYYDPNCDPDVQPFCEPAQIPSTPNVSVGMEAFQDTPIVNGVAYPKTTVDPKAYRYRILNGADDRFFDLQWYVADPTTGTMSEVALNASEVAAANEDPNVVPTPDTNLSPAGPSWIQIGTEGGFLPTPTVVPAQPLTWITDPTRFDVGNVDQHSLLLGPAERADVIVDFSQYRGKTLILYNDAPAAFPARQANMDYYTGGPDLTASGGAHTTLPGYGPNTRTIMQVKVSTATPAVAFDRPNTTNDRMGALMAAFAHHLDPVTQKPAGVFESGSDPVIVGQAAYNTAYGTSFASSGYCNTKSTSPQPAKCDGFARIQQQGGDPFTFDTLSGNKLSIPLQPKGIHDEMNSASFDEWGRMTANIGLEAPGATPIAQNIILYPFSNPATEILDGTAQPSSLDVTKISTRIRRDPDLEDHPQRGGYAPHPLPPVQRAGAQQGDLGQHHHGAGAQRARLEGDRQRSVRSRTPTWRCGRSLPTIPFGLPDSVRPLNPAMPVGASGDLNGPFNGQEAGFNNTDTNGNPMTTAIVNAITNFGWEYVWHCHMLSHEEMDMMRPMTLAVARNLPAAPVLSLTKGAGTVVNLAWTDGTPVELPRPAAPGRSNSSKAEIGYKIQRAPITSAGSVGCLGDLSTALANQTSTTDGLAGSAKWFYRVVAWNAAGESTSNADPQRRPSGRSDDGRRDSRQRPGRPELDCAGEQRWGTRDRVRRPALRRQRNDVDDRLHQHRVDRHHRNGHRPDQRDELRVPCRGHQRGRYRRLVGQLRSGGTERAAGCTHHRHGHGRQRPGDPDLDRADGQRRDRGDGLPDPAEHQRWDLVDDRRGRHGIGRGHPGRHGPDQRDELRVPCRGHERDGHRTVRRPPPPQSPRGTRSRRRARRRRRPQWPARPAARRSPSRWVAPANGGSAITGYALQYTTNGGTSYVTVTANSGTTAVTRTVTGLTAGTSYRFRVAAINAVGTSTYSSLSTAVAAR